ncbi:MAG: 16S rRNA (guanine(527)-N(7))-methyltransferase RsmG [candidate division NC10 bacterium]|nr:16S rRNA (guanine(527)-N(7))-methyltransferase RsmG [candidate division NC10 bacterium]
MEDRSPPFGVWGLLWQAARDLGLHLASEQMEAFALYGEELLRWNRRMNLTGARREAEVVIDHFLASLAFAVAFPQGVPQRLADIGSGAGFPGIPLKIALPHLQVVLVEASRKKVSFLRHICTLLELKGIEPIRGRAEELASDPAHQQRFDLCVARAVGRKGFLLKVAGLLLRPGGRLIVSGREKEEGQVPGSSLLAFREVRKVGLPTPGLERSLLIWETRGPAGD